MSVSGGKSWKGLAIAAVVGLFLAVDFESFGASAEERRVFLDAESIGQLGLTQDELEPRFVQLLDSAVAEAPDQIPELILHTHDLIRHEQINGDGWIRNMWNGWTVMAEIMARYTSKDRPDLEMLGVYVRLHRADREGVFPSGGGFSDSVHRALWQRFFANGGNYDPATAMDLLSEELRRYCGEGEVIFLLPAFAKFGDYLRPKQNQALTEWAGDVVVGNREGDIDIARCLLFGLQMFAATEMPRAGNSDLVDFEEQMIEILRDESISPAWRQGLAANLSAVDSIYMGDALRFEIGRRCAVTFANDIPFSSIGMAYCLSAFLHPSRDDATWKNIALTVSEGWRHRNRYNGRDKKYGLALDPSRFTVVPMMELTCRLGDQEGIEWHVRVFGDTWGAFPGMLISLVKAGEHLRAADYLMRYGEEFRYRSDFYRIDPRYDNQLHEAIPAFLEKVDEPEWRKFAALILAATPDPELSKIEEPPFPRVSARIDYVAGEIRDRPFRKKLFASTANEILSTAFNEPNVREVLKHPPGAFFDQLASNRDWTRSSTDIYWLTYTELHSPLCLLSEGKPFPAQFFWGRLVFEDLENQRHLHRYGSEAVVDKLLEWMEYQIGFRNRSQMQKLNLFSRQVLETVPKEVYSSDIHNLLCACLISHAYCGQSGEFNEWWNALPHDRQSFLVDLLSDKMGLIGRTASLINPGELPPSEWESDPELRREFFFQIATNPLVDAAYGKNILLSYAVARELIDEEDALSVAGRIAARAPRHGIALQEWFGTLADQGKYEEALEKMEEWVEGVQHNEPEMKEEERNALAMVLAEKALLLSSLDRSADALRSLERLGALPEPKAPEIKAYCKLVQERLSQRLSVVR